MLVPVLQKIGQTSRFFLPAATVLFFVLLSVLVWPLPFVGPIAPSFGLAAVYYWSIYRPDLFSPSVSFFLGLLNDAIHFLPPGLSAFIFVGVRQLAFSQRRFFIGQTFFMLWFGFALVAFLAVLVSGGVLAFLNGRFAALFPVLIQYLLTLAVFPLPAWILIRLQRNLLSQG